MTELTKTIDLRIPIADQVTIDTSTPDAADTTIALLRDACEQLQRKANDYRLEKVRALDDGEAFVRTGQDGRTVRAVKTVVPLRESQGHLYGIPMKGVKNPDGSWNNNAKKWKLSAEGVTYLNGFVGVTVLTPPTQLVDGRRVENPFIEREQGVARRVYVRKVAIGRTATGTLVASDHALCLDANLYTAEALRKLRKKLPEAVFDMNRSDYDAERGKGNLRGSIFHPYAVFGGEVLGVVANLANDAVKSVMDTHTQFVQFLERRAQTICQRNALRHHPAIGVYTVTPQSRGGENVVLVPVWSWAEDASMLEESQRAQRQIAAGMDPAEAGVRVETSAEEADPTDADVLVDGEIVQDDKADEPGGPDESGQLPLGGTE